jgi:HTH-type transcriptional regulator, competence development regulator
METFGQRIKTARKAKGISLREAAEQIGVSAGYLSQLENDTANWMPKEDAIIKIGEFYGENADLLMALAGKIPEELRTMMRDAIKSGMANELRNQMFAMIRKAS